jgi:hypothetical protein
MGRVYFWAISKDSLIATFARHRREDFGDCFYRFHRADDSLGTNSSPGLAIRRTPHHRAVLSIISDANNRLDAFNSDPLMVFAGAGLLERLPWILN